MEKTTLWALSYIFVFSSSFLCQINASNKQLQALNNLYTAKWFRNSAIDNSHYESLQHTNKGKNVSVRITGYRSQNAGSISRKFRGRLGEMSKLLGNKHTQALNHFHTTKRSLNSAIETSHLEPPQHVNNASVLSQEALKKNDKIDKLPGQPYVRFDQYGGYITVNQSAGRAFYYYFVEADNTSKDSLPLLLWLNGGPGCSSLAYGAMQELGPFRVNSDGKTLYRNDFSWNHAANVLFVESPAGVGFSYSNTSSDYENSGDQSTAMDNYVFLLNWLERFPEYKEREFYISGESYAGHYVPQLADAILYHNKLANRTLINLKGILIGNAVISDETDTMGMYDYFGSHAIVSDEILDQIHIYCDFSQNATKQSDKCLAANAEVNRNIDHIDIYNIYAPLCSKEILTSKPKPMSHAIDPCSEHYTSVYMNRQDVQEALHANVTKLDHDWQPCSEVITKWNDSPSTIIPLLREFLKNNLRVWIFSGDTDARIPVTSTKYSINSMSLPIKTPWQAWLYHGKVGGFVQVYEGDLTFATVLGAGHQVPSYKPKSALGLITHFLTGKSLNNSRY